MKDTSKITHSIIIHEHKYTQNTEYIRSIIIHEHKYTQNTEYIILESGGHTHSETVNKTQPNLEISLITVIR